MPAPGVDVLSDARSFARDLLAQVLGRHRALDDALAGHAALAMLEPRDRAFARLLVATVLRRLGELDAAIDRRLERPLPPRAMPVRDALRLGIAQLAFLGTPPHAAVDTSVAAMAGRLAPYRGLVNAVLRSVARDGLPAMDAPRCNTPDWLWNSWVGAYGEDETRAIAAAHLSEPPLDLTVRSDPHRWAEMLNATMLPTGSLRRIGGGVITEFPGYADGAWWIQDAAAALPVRLLGNVAGQRVADLCAAPGGKAAQLAAAGAQVIAVDISRKRLAQLRENLTRLGLEAECRVADARDLTPSESFDAILLDAPCSGTGTIRRHPDIARLKAPEDVARLIRIQADMLDAAMRCLRPGGTLVYAVCSLQPDEGVAQVDALLARNPAVRRAPIRADEIPAPFVTGRGDLQTLPSHWPEFGGVDGFFAARLIRDT